MRPELWVLDVDERLYGRAERPRMKPTKERNVAWGTDLQAGLRIVGKRYIAWVLPDPAEMDLAQARKLRKRIAALVKDLAAELPKEVHSFHLADKKHSFRQR